MPYTALQPTSKPSRPRFDSAAQLLNTVQIVADSEGEIAEKFHGGADDAVRVPVFYRCVIADIAVAGDDAAHRGGVGGLHVAQVVAQVQALSRLGTAERAGLEQRIGGRRGKRAGVAADQAGGAQEV